MKSTTARRFGSSGKSFTAPATVAPTIGAALLASGTSETADTAWSPSAACLLPDILPVAGTLLSYGGSRQLAAGGTVTHSGALTLGGALTAGTLKLGATSASAMVKQGTSTEAGNVPGMVVRDATDAGYMSLHARRVTVSDGLLGCWNGSEWNGWVIYSDVLAARSTGRIAWSNTSSSLGGTEDLKMIRVSAGLASVCGNAGLKIQNFAGSADAALTCGNLTASGQITATNGTYASPSIVFASGAGIYSSSNSILMKTPNGSLSFLSNSGLEISGAITASGAVTTSTISTTATSLRFDSTTTTDYWGLDHSVPGYGGALQLLSSAGTPRLTLIGRTDRQALHFENTSGSAFVGNGLGSFGSSVRNGFIFDGYAIGGGVTLIASNNSGVMNPILRLGGTTSSFPAIKRSGTTTAFRLADDSADGPISCGAITTSGNVNITGTSASPLTINTSSSSAAIYFDSSAVGNHYFGFKSLGVTKWLIGNQYSDHSLLVYNANASSVVASLTQTGKLTISDAICETPTQSSLNPTTTNIPTGKRQGWYNSALSEFRDWVNIGGTLLKSAAYT